MKYVVSKKNTGLFVAESHYFDAKGRRQLTLTDDMNLAEEMTLDEANTFLAKNKGFIILEKQGEMDEDE